jgi:Kef-type K+ transport system membrane component KefB
MGTVALGFAPSVASPVALFMGAILTATSVGIGARVLSDLGAIASPEGVTIIGAAVVDDVLVILVLSVVIAFTATGEVSWGQLGLVSLKAIGFWVTLTGLMILASKWISRFFTGFRVGGASLTLALALALLGAGLAETFGLAMIIGAYSVGLGLSGTPLAREIEEHLAGIYHFLVPIFFVAMGMLVDVTALGDVIVLGSVLTLLAIVGKVAGAGVPALAVGFNRRGAWRIGLGMLPRGEVGLIVAGVGLARGVINQQEFGVAIMMVLVTTVLATILLVPAFRSGLPGTRKAAGALESGSA